LSDDSVVASRACT